MQLHSKLGSFLRIQTKRLYPERAVKWCHPLPKG